MSGVGSHPARSDNDQAGESDWRPASQWFGGDPAGMPAVEKSAGGGCSVRRRPGRLLQWADLQDDPQSFRGLPSQNGHDRPRGYGEGSGSGPPGGDDVRFTDDTRDHAVRPSTDSRAATAASIAVDTSASVPLMKNRPYRPTARTSTTLIEAAFSASLAATAE